MTFKKKVQLFNLIISSSVGPSDSKSSYLSLDARLHHLEKISQNRHKETDALIQQFQNTLNDMTHRFNLLQEKYQRDTVQKLGMRLDMMERMILPKLPQ